MNAYVAQLLVSTKRGLSDKTVLVRAASIAEARAKVERIYPKAVVGYVGEELA